MIQTYAWFGSSHDGKQRRFDPIVRFIIVFIFLGSIRSRRLIHTWVESQIMRCNEKVSHSNDLTSFSNGMKTTSKRFDAWLEFFFDMDVELPADEKPRKAR